MFTKKRYSQRKAWRRLCTISVHAQWGGQLVTNESCWSKGRQKCFTVCKSEALSRTHHLPTTVLILVCWLDFPFFTCLFTFDSSPPATSWTTTKRLKRLVKVLWMFEILYQSAPAANLAFITFRNLRRGVQGSSQVDSRVGGYEEDSPWKWRWGSSIYCYSWDYYTQGTQSSQHC